MSDEEDFFHPRAKSPVPAALATSVVTTLVLLVGFKVLDDRGLLPSFGKSNAAPPPAAVIDVPDIVGTRIEQARAMLNGQDLLLVLSSRQNSSQPAGTIAEQNPLAGSQTRKGAAVQAVLSTGPKQIVVPDLSGQRVDEAHRQLAARDLRTGQTKETPNDTAPVGTVLQSAPPSGSAVAAQAIVDLVVSAGPGTKTMPKFVGLRFRAAKELAEKEGFKVGKVRHVDDGDHLGGSVLEQTPAANAPVAPGTAIDLTVNAD